ncbi:two-component system activity regulator YycH [Bacillus sp. B190/17]|uniref:Two-component system activity regulator YycH n=1 Tax=Bacillus lumedeiriae TaxID=3058829 RepID=A0ABW8IBP5_9BACI
MNYEKVKSIGLAVLVVISIILTLSIWNYQPNYETIKKDNIHEVSSISEKKDASYLIKPSKVLFHKEGEHYGSTRDIETDEVMKEMQKWTFTSAISVSKGMTEKEFDELLHGENRLELVFPTYVPLYMMDTIIVFEDDSVPNAMFDRIIITDVDTQEKRASVYFVSTKERLVFQSQVLSLNLSAFKKQFIKGAEKWESYVHYPLVANGQLFLPEEQPVLSRYKYLPDDINIEDFKDLLFSDPSLVKKVPKTNGEEYTDGSTLMKVDYNTHMISYVNPAKESETNPSGSLYDLLDKSIKFINEHSGWTDQYRLFEAQQGSSTVRYRLFKNGLPVFNNQGMAEIVQMWGKDKIFQYVRPYFTLDISLPLPSDEEEIILPDSTSALKQVKKREDFNPELLEDMAVGYQLQSDSQSPKVIVLEPAWFYKYEGSWRQLSFIEDTEGSFHGLE